MKKNNLYRLSALLYRDDVSILNRTNTITKVIESYFVIKSNQSQHFKELSNGIKTEFSLLFHDEEIESAIKTKHFLSIPEKENKPGIGYSLISLTKERYQYLRSIQKENNIYRYIVDFHKSSKLDDDIALPDFVKLIENFLYKIFIQNLEKSKSLFDKSLDIGELVEQLSFSNKDKELINMFLDYDNPDKDKAIFNIGSWAVEFATINGHVDLESQLNNITQKTLYLDTNVLFRLIGIDGERRQQRLENFLERCKSSGQSLKITKTVMDEYHKSFETGIKHIKEIPSNLKFTAPIENSIVHHYYKLNGLGIDLYLAEVELIFCRFIKKLNIEIESNDFYREAKGHQRVKIDQYSESIKHYKYQRNEYQSLPDATNIVYIDSLRKGHGFNFNDSMYFFLTVDKALTKWEQEAYDGCPITMRPSDWLTLLLKYVSRTTDDYKAFVSFIQTVIQTEHKEPETILAMLVGISQIADKLETQKELYSTLLSQKYDEILSIDTFDGKVEYSKEITSGILEEQLRVLEEKRLQDKADADKKFNIMEQEIEEIKIERASDNEQAKKDRASHIRYVQKTERGKVIVTCILSSIFVIPSLLALVMIWCFTAESWNFVYRFLYITFDKVVIGQLTALGILITVLIPSGSILWNHTIGDKNLKSRLTNADITEKEIDELKIS